MHLRVRPPLGKVPSEYFHPYTRDSPAYLLMDGLLKLLVVEDGPDLAVAVTGPEWGVDLDLGLADIRPECWLLQDVM